MSDYVLFETREKVGIITINRPRANQPQAGHRGPERPRPWGGFELALACHFRFIKEGARIGLTETNLGIMPGYGGTLRLPRLIGRAAALECMVLGKQIEADEALVMGLVNLVCGENAVLDEAVAFGNEPASRPPLAVRAVLKVMSMSQSVSPEQHLKVEREELAKLFGTKDMMEGMTAFAQKRHPEFAGT